MDLVRWDIRRTTRKHGNDELVSEVYETTDTGTEIAHTEELRPFGAMCYQSDANYGVFGTFGTMTENGQAVKVYTYHVVMRRGGLCPFCGGSRLNNLRTDCYDCFFCEKTGLIVNVPEYWLKYYADYIADREGGSWIDAMEEAVRVFKVDQRNHASYHVT